MKVGKIEYLCIMRAYTAHIFQIRQIINIVLYVVEKDIRQVFQLTVFTIF